MKFTREWEDWEQAVILEFFKKIRGEFCGQCKITHICNNYILEQCYIDFLHMAEEEFEYNLRGPQ